jgi:hypothetical protein
LKEVTRGREQRRGRGTAVELFRPCREQRRRCARPSRPCSEAEEEQGGGVAGDGEEEAAGEKERRGRGGEDLGGGCEIKARVLPGVHASAVAALRHCCREASRNPLEPLLPWWSFEACVLISAVGQRPPRRPVMDSDRGV